MPNSKNLGVQDGQLAPMPKSPNAVSSQTDDASKKVEPLAMSGDIASTMAKIKQCLMTLGGNKIVSETDNYLHVVFTTKIMRFKDDVEFYIDEAAQQVHFRSASRVGYSDLGANRKRYEAFKAIYK